jgi:transcription elongation factor GreA
VKTPITRSGYDRLVAELQRLKEERPLISRAIGAAIEHGDLRENADYHASKERQGIVEARIVQIESILSTAEVIDPSTLTGTRVRFGARVTVLDGDTGQRCEYTIVGEHESDAARGLISIKSPIARALMGKEPGAVVEVSTPRGERELEVVAVSFG